VLRNYGTVGAVKEGMKTTTNKATETETQARRARWQEQMDQEDALFEAVQAEVSEEQGW